jgi:hypothetical protein
VKRTSSFVAITTEGGLLPADFLSELLSPKADIDGLTPTSYNLADGERISEQVNRSWNRLKGRWADFKKAISEKPADEFRTTETRNRWLQPLFQELGYGQRLIKAKPIEIDGKNYPVSHAWNHVPMHLVGAHIDLDNRTPGVVGAAKASPHSLLQQLLNASDEHLWGIVCNGLNVRLLRDNIALTRQALVEWDLAAIFDGDLYSEFFLLWLVLHQSRFDAERPEQCWLERWKKKAENKGLRALDKLRLGVTRAIQALGEGLLSHPANNALQSRLRKGELTTQDFYRQVLKVIYRILFLLVAEDRELLHTPIPNDQDKNIFDREICARQRYRDFYSVGRLRHLTLLRAGTPHTDIWQTFQLISEKLGSNEGCPELALPALGSFLWDASRSTRDLNDTLISNHQLITAVHALTFVQDGSIRRFVDYKNLGAEELGGVYEGLLELHPTIDTDAGTFQLDLTAGNERKTSGSYYTPESLVQCLLDSALDPVVAEVIRDKKSEAAVNALLNLKICDPAAGSGHFLIAAAHRLAKHVAAARSGEDEPSPTATRTALRDVIGRCIYGVDINPMAVELCKVSLWIEAVEPGKPLSFLDHHIQCGNGLLGATPALIGNGIPDDAFKPIEGDDPKLCTKYRKQNRREFRQDTLLGFHGERWEHLGDLATNMVQITSLPDDRLEDVHAKEERYAELIHSDLYEFSRALADAWCASFVWKKVLPAAGGFNYPITNEIFRQLERKPHDVPKWMRDEIKRLAEQYQFFHWHLAFPEVFQMVPTGSKAKNELSGWNGGFDVNLGNPPWERVKLQDREWFAKRRPDIANARNAAARKRMIGLLRTADPVLFEQFTSDLRRADGENQLIRKTGRYPLCGKGDTNLYAVFAELGLSIINEEGRAGLVVPPGIVTDATYKEFAQHVVANRSIVSFYDFTNRGYIFPSTESTFAFALITLSRTPHDTLRMAAQLWNTTDLQDQERVFVVSAETIERLSPNTKTFPIVRSTKDLRVVSQIYKRLPILVREVAPISNPWNCQLASAFHMANDSDVFKTEHDFAEADAKLDGNRLQVETELLVPLYESKLAHQFNHRHASFVFGDSTPNKYGTRARTNLIDTQQLESPTYLPVPRYWVGESDADAHLPPQWPYNWFLVYRRTINAVADSRSVVASIIPRYAVGDSLFLILPQGEAQNATALLALLNSFAFDYVARQKASGGNLNFYVMKQLPVITPVMIGKSCSQNAGVTNFRWIQERVLELTYTAWDLAGFAMDCGWSGPPFRWDEQRRFLLRCELDAAFFHLYGLNRDDAAYVLDTFPIVRRKDEEKHNGDYRTKQVILEIYHEMANAVSTGSPYFTRLDPPPADTRVAHRPSYCSLPLMLPKGFRFSQADQNVYAMRIILSMLTLSANRMEIFTLMTACGLLARPERLRTFARDVNPDIVVAWSRSFSDTFDPNLFLPTIDELVRRGELNLEREGQKFMVNRVGTMHIVTDPYIEFDALLALQVEGSLTEAERQSISPMASSQEIEVRFKVA